MAIATITPLNNTQTSLLAQALNGSTGTLAQAINTAIQRGMQDANAQLQQENAAMQEQQRNIENERIERFDRRNRAQFLMNFTRQERQDQVGNAIAQQDAEIKRQKFGFEKEDREMAQELGVTDPEVIKAKLGFEKEENQIRRDEASGRIENQRLDNQIDKENLEIRKAEASEKKTERDKKVAADDVRTAYYRDLQEAEQITDPIQREAKKRDIYRIANADDTVSSDLLKELGTRLGITTAKAADEQFTPPQRSADVGRASDLEQEVAAAEGIEEGQEGYMPKALRDAKMAEAARLRKQAREGNLTTSPPTTKPGNIDKIYGVLGK